MPSFEGSCHCGAVRFRFDSEPIVRGMACNCSICSRKGAVVSETYVPAARVEILAGRDQLRGYRFGDRSVVHHFCGTCGIHPFIEVESIPPEYEGPARPGDVRINLRCVDGVDVDALAITRIDGRAY